MFDLSNLFYCKLQVMLQVTSLFVRQTNMKKRSELGLAWACAETMALQWRLANRQGRKEARGNNVEQQAVNLLRVKCIVSGVPKFAFSFSFRAFSIANLVLVLKSTI